MVSQVSIVRPQTLIPTQENSIALPLALASLTLAQSEEAFDKNNDGSDIVLIGLFLEAITNFVVVFDGIAEMKAQTDNRSSNVECERVRLAQVSSAITNDRLPELQSLKIQAGVFKSARKDEGSILA
ncbi:hypothetical protein HG530_001425 [Fusarium avenaceum]|nr:hypothetical protein HG530_001425 [Fusarium avenaceum]